MAAIPAQPAAPINFPNASLPVPAAPAAAIPTAAEAANIRLYVTTLAHTRMLAPNAVTLAEYTNWSAYSTAVDSAAGGVAAAIAAAIAPLTASTASLSASIGNIRIANRNYSAIERVDKNPTAAARAAAANVLVIEALRKETAGAGVPPGGDAVTPAIIALLPAGHPVAVGTAVPSPPFPATLQLLRSLTQNEIAALGVAYNDGFGIAAGDTLTIKRQKFESWVRGAYQVSIYESSTGSR